MPKILNDPRARVLREVEGLLLQGSYSAVTIREVANRCGLGVGTVYNYFPSKEAMVAQLLLEEWKGCIAAISAAGGGAEAVAQSIYDQLRQFSRRHSAVFQDEAARGSFAGSFSQYHTLLRSQLAAPLRPFCGSEFASEFLAEALLTWTMAGKDFSEIWGLLGPITN